MASVSCFHGLGASTATLDDSRNNRSSRERRNFRPKRRRRSRLTPRRRGSTPSSFLRHGVETRSTAPDTSPHTSTMSLWAPVSSRSTRDRPRCSPNRSPRWTNSPAAVEYLALASRRTTLLSDGTGSSLHPRFAGNVRRSKSSAKRSLGSRSSTTAPCLRSITSKCASNQTRTSRSALAHRGRKTAS